MTDLFGPTPSPKPKPRPGTGNGRFIGHRANGMSRAQLKANLEAGEYPDVHPSYLTEAGISA